MGEFRMPSLGADMEEGTIVEWRVAPGDVVKKGDIVAVVDTEKSDIDIEVFESGTVGEILVPAGTKVPVGTPIATIETAGAAPAPAPARPKISPRARRRAAELGVDAAALAAAHGPRSVDTAAVEAASTPAVVPAARGGALAAVGRLMERSKREIPHFYVREDVDVTAALEWMQHRNADRPVQERLLPAALLLRAVVLGLRDAPDLNAHYVGGAVEQFEHVHLGVAIAQRGGGLVAPVIRDAHERTLDELMEALTGLVARARKGALRSSDVDGATITVTSLGEQGARELWGVIVPPQVAIVGFGRIAERPWAERGMLGVRQVVTATLSADHRVSHGHQGALFLRSVARTLERPEVLTQ